MNSVFKIKDNLTLYALYALRSDLSIEVRTFLILKSANRQEELSVKDIGCNLPEH